MTPPSKHKMALLTFVIVYPMITVLLAALEPLLSDLAMPLRTLLLSLIMVPSMVYGAMPFATSRLKRWLAERTDAQVTEKDKINV